MAVVVYVTLQRLAASVTRIDARSARTLMSIADDINTPAAEDRVRTPLSLLFLISAAVLLHRMRQLGSIYVRFVSAAL